MVDLVDYEDSPVPSHIFWWNNEYPPHVTLVTAPIPDGIVDPSTSFFDCDKWCFT